MELRIYLTVDGRAPFEEWLEALRDVTGRARIRVRLARVQAVEYLEDWKRRGRP